MKNNDYEQMWDNENGYTLLVKSPNPRYKYEYRRFDNSEQLLAIYRPDTFDSRQIESLNDGEDFLDWDWIYIDYTALYYSQLAKNWQFVNSGIFCNPVQSGCYIDVNIADKIIKVNYVNSGTSETYPLSLDGIDSVERYTDIKRDRNYTPLHSISIFD